MAAGLGVCLAPNAITISAKPPLSEINMNIKLYKTDLRPELNEVFDDIALFLADLQPKHQWANVK